LSIPQILAWADEWFERTGKWPQRTSGLIPGSLGEKWQNMENNLRRAGRGLPLQTTLAQLLAEHRGKRNRKDLPPYTVEQVLAWADAHYQSTGAWPKHMAGAIAAAPGETWAAVETALQKGQRGLPGGSSLAQVLTEHRGMRNEKALPSLTEHQVLAWADAHHQRERKWPTSDSGAIPDAPGETWSGVETALQRGGRGFPGESSLARLLARHRGKRNLKAVPALTEEHILAWADAHHQRTGQWPSKSSGPVVGAPGETWLAVHSALNRGRRGLPGGSTLAQLLTCHRGVRNVQALPALTEEQVHAWAEEHYRRTGQWPNKSSGPVVGAPGETWLAVNASLRVGRRGLPGGSSLGRFLAERR